MNDINIFKNSVYISDKDKIVINKGFNDFINSFIKHIDSLEVPYNLYLSGSLARGEPSIVYNDNKPILNSDIDFVIATKSEFIELLKTKIKNKLFFCHYNYQYSLIVIDIKKLNSTKSMFGKDLRNSIYAPIKKTIDIGNVDKYTPVKEDYFECFIYQIIKYLYSVYNKSNDDRNSTIYLSIKLILESFKIACCKSYDLNGYYDLINYSNFFQNKEYLNILKYIKRREVFNNRINVEGFENIIIKNLKTFYNCKNNNELYKKIKQQVLNSNDFVELSQLCFLVVFFICKYNILANDSYLELLNIIIKKINLINSDNYSIDVLFPIEFGNKENFMYLISQLSKLKHKYIEEIYIKNKGDEC